MSKTTEKKFKVTLELSVDDILMLDMLLARGSWYSTALKNAVHDRFREALRKKATDSFVKKAQKEKDETRDRADRLEAPHLDWSTNCFGKRESRLKRDAFHTEDMKEVRDLREDAINIEKLLKVLDGTAYYS